MRPPGLLSREWRRAVLYQSTEREYDVSIPVTDQCERICDPALPTALTHSRPQHQPGLQSARRRDRAPHGHGRRSHVRAISGQIVLGGEAAGLPLSPVLSKVEGSVGALQPSRWCHWRVMEAVTPRQVRHLARRAGVSRRHRLLPGGTHAATQSVRCSTLCRRQGQGEPLPDMVTYDHLLPQTRIYCVLGFAVSR
jgi:hypothetical protein